MAQAVFSSLTGELTDRFPASRVLSVAVASQAVLVAAAFGAMALGLSPWLLHPFYGLIGGAVGVAETARRIIPPLLLQRDPAALKAYNARLHIYYEIAGVSGALLAGLLLWLAGPTNALLLPPLPYLISGLVFWRVVHASESPERPEPRGRGISLGGMLLERVKDYGRDLWIGARTVLGERRFRWIAAAMILPQIAHRILENLLIPVYANGILRHGALSSVLLTASNLGELLGAWLLLRKAEQVQEPSVWVRWSVPGLMGIWALALAAGLPLALGLALLVPSFVVLSLTWAASDLSLLTDLQHRLGERERARAFSFLYGVFIVSVTFGSLGIGRFLDAVPLASAFLWIPVVSTLLAGLLWLASRLLASGTTGDPGHP